MNLNRYSKIIITVLTCLAVGYISSFATQSSINSWYVTLEKPFFNPPNWIFAPVWTVLYILMGISFGLIWSTPSIEKSILKKAMIYFSIQLGLNFIWSVLFFGLQNSLLAFIEITLLILYIYETIRIFKTINTSAAILLYPYLIWVSFASILNGSIWWLNQ